MGTALAVGGSASAAVDDLLIQTPQVPAFSGLSGFAAGITQPIAPGVKNQPTANFSVDFSKPYAAGNKIRVQLVGDPSVANNCSTAGKVDSSVGFAKVPDIEVLNHNGSVNQDAQSNQGNLPTFTAKLVGNNAVCETSGVFNEIEITLDAPPNGPLDQNWRLAFSDVELNAGPETHITNPIGAIGLDVTGTGALGGGDTDNYTSVAAGKLKVADVVASNAGNDSDDTTIPDITVSDVRDSSAAPTVTNDSFFVPGQITRVVVAPATLGTVQSKIDQGGADPVVTGDADHTIRPGSIDRSSAGFLSFDVVTGVHAKTGSIKISGLRTDVDNGGQGQVKFIAARTTFVNNNGSVKANPFPGDVLIPSISTLDAGQNVVDYDNRLGGQDRYETAAKIYDATFGNTQNAVVSGGENFPDALGANYLASQVGGGVLLTKHNTLPAITKKALIDHRVRTVYLTGGEGAASTAVEQAIEAIQVNNDPTSAHIQVQRVAGATRYATNKAVNQVKAPVSGSSTVLLASGEGFADALSLGPIAYHNGYPVILTDGQTLGADQIAQLDSFNADRVVIAGGTASVSQGVEDAIKAKGIDTFRLAGDTRQSTAAKIALWATEGLRKANGNRESGILGQAQGLNGGGIILTQGTAFADALSAGAAGANGGYPIILGQDANTLGADATSYLSNKFVRNQLFGPRSDVATIVPVGLTMAVTNSMVNDAAKAIERK
jgi:putative cell wall-binding protein